MNMNMRMNMILTKTITPRIQIKKEMIEVTIKVTVKEEVKDDGHHQARHQEPPHPRDEEPQHTIVAIFDDNDRVLNVAPLREGVAKLALPREQEGRVVRVLYAPAEEGIKTPSLARLRRNLAVEERAVLRPDFEIHIDPNRFKLWRRSCCRVRGRVFTKVVLPNGTVQERPLCNARVVICEVDASTRGIIDLLPHNMVYRLRDEWPRAVRAPQAAAELAPHLKAARHGIHLRWPMRLG